MKASLSITKILRTGIPLSLIAIGITTTSALGSTAESTTWSIRSSAMPTYISPARGGTIQILATNPTSQPSAEGETVTITDTLPAGLDVSSVSEEEAIPNGNTGTCTNTTTTITCTYEHAIAANNTDGLAVRIAVTVMPGTSGVLPGNMAMISGGGLAQGTSTDSLTVSTGTPSFGLTHFSLAPTNTAGTLDTQAGDHPNALTTGLEVTSMSEPLEPATIVPVQEVRDITVDLPLGLVGNPQTAPTCPQALLSDGSNGIRCPSGSIIGTVAFSGTFPKYEISTLPETEPNITPIFNVPAEHGYPAEFAFIFKGRNITMYPSVIWTPEGYDLQVTTPNIPLVQVFTGIQLTFFGQPGTVDGVSPDSAFFTNPTSCSSSETASISIDSWQGGSAHESTTLPSMQGCNALQFNPAISAQPTRTTTGSPSGFDFALQVPQNSNPTGLATSELKNLTLALPQGMTISPSSANGLEACSEAQIALDSTEAATCPEASIIGSVTLHTPLLAEPLQGQVFLGSPACSPCSSTDAQEGKLIKLFIEVANPNRGVDIKLAGTVSINPTTGQLTATFDNNPQLPFEDITLQLKDGPRAPLSTPQTCGTYTTESSLEPWSHEPAPSEAEGTPNAQSQSQFTINEGCGVQGFTPSFTAGTTSTQAGTYSPFTLTFARTDGEQDLHSIEQTLPPGLLAKLAGVPQCGNAEASAGTCPQSSEIGMVTVGAGPGSDPYYVQGHIYLTGPYNGGPFGEVVEVPAVAGPFNLGTVVVRGSIRINPSTAQATIVSDPFPSILDGIPLQVKTVNVTLNRPGFTFNPTNCTAQKVTGAISSTAGASAGVSSPFQAVNCATLPFKPTFTAATAGQASKAGGASLVVKIASKGGPGASGEEANIRSVKVDLPKQLPSRLPTLHLACLAATFEANPADCPKESDVGMATAVTPVLASPLRGPAYLVSYGNEKFPNLEIVLQGEGVTLVLEGNTQIKNGVTSSTFKTVPDAPISSFELKLPTGKYSILTTNLPQSTHYSLCGQTLNMPTAITGQNGAEIRDTTKLAVSGCAKAKTLTRAQKLTNALKECRKKGDKAKRATCEATARKQFGPTTKKKGRK